jgi:hypothetical protein
MSEEKIGTDILDYTAPPSRISKKRAEDMKRAQEELKKKRKKASEEEEKAPEEEVPGETPHEITPEERTKIAGELTEEVKEKLEQEEEEEESKKDVHVTSHYRGRPKKS